MRPLAWLKDLRGRLRLESENARLRERIAALEKENGGLEKRARELIHELGPARQRAAVLTYQIHELSEHAKILGMREPSLRASLRDYEETIRRLRREIEGMKAPAESAS